MPDTIFVFGSNMAGRHGLGAARTAYRQFGAIRGQAVGLQGRSYAIPTKDVQFEPLAMSTIRYYVREFLDFARSHPELTFQVTRIGCGLAGFDDEDIAPMFAGAPDNCHLPEGWRR